MQQTVSVEKSSPILRKLTVKVAAAEVKTRFERGLAEVQRTAKLKGFRPGQAPITIIRQYYGEDVRHQVFHRLIDESYRVAVRDEKLRAVGQPQIETPSHQTGKGEHDHNIGENEDLQYTATVEVLPEIEVKNYTGIALKRESADISNEDVEKVVTGMLDSKGTLAPVERKAKKGDFADITFKGAYNDETGKLVELPGMAGTRMVELGSGTLIPGFEEEVEGMKSGETSTFKIKFPADYHEPKLQGKDAEFTVTVNSLKEKQLPEFNDEFAKEFGYESAADCRAKAREHLVREKTMEVDSKLRNDLVAAIIEKNPFDCPAALIESQARALAQDWARELKNQGADDGMIQNIIGGQLDQMRKKAESQVRASLLLEAICDKEGIKLGSDDMEAEYDRSAKSMKVEKDKLKEYYAKNAQAREDLEFRLKQDMTLKFLLDKAKIK